MNKLLGNVPPEVVSLVCGIAENVGVEAWTDSDLDLVVEGSDETVAELKQQLDVISKIIDGMLQTW